MQERLKQSARRLKRETLTLYVAYRDPRVPWYARVLAACVVAYALSPIDLIPDFIPVLGYLDDLLLVPLGVVLALRLLPPDVLAEARAEAALLAEKPVSRVGAIAIVTVWLLLLAISVALVVRWLA